MSCRVLVAVYTVLLLLGLSATGKCEADGPGFQSRVLQYVVDYSLQASVTQQALDYANQKAMDALAAQIPKTEIPDQSGKSGHMHYSLTNMCITEFTKPSSSIRVDTKTGLTWSASNAGFSLHSDWRVKWLKIPASGSVDVSVSGVSFSITVTASADSAGTLSIKLGACTCSVGDVSVRVHGKLRKVLDLFRHMVESRVRDVLPDKLCHAVNHQVNSRAHSVLDKVNEASGVVTTVAVVILVSVTAAIVGLWCLSRVVSMAVLSFVGGIVISVVLWLVIAKAQDAMPEILDYLSILT